MFPPNFSTRLADTAVNDGQQLELVCKVTGDPEPQITWLKNGKVTNIYIYTEITTKMIIIVVRYTT